MGEKRKRKIQCLRGVCTGALMQITCPFINSALCVQEVLCLPYVCMFNKLLCAVFEPCGVLLALASLFVSVHTFMINL